MEQETKNKQKRWIATQILTSLKEEVNIKFVVTGEYVNAARFIDQAIREKIEREELKKKEVFSNERKIAAANSVA